MRTPLKKAEQPPMGTGAIYRSDAVELLQGLPNESVDLVILDPAYESLEKWRKLGSTTRLKESKGSSNKWFETFPNVRYWELFRELFRVLKKSAHLYVFCDEETRDLLATGYSPQTDDYIEGRSDETSGCRGGKLISGGPIVSAGFKYWKAIVWAKVLAGMGYHYRAQHEFIIMAEKVLAKGKHRQLNSAKFGDVVEIPEHWGGAGNMSAEILSVRMLKGAKYYPTEKPYNLIKVLVEQSSNPGDVVLDPMCGSGVVGEVCRDTGRDYLLGDLDVTEAERRLT